MTTQCVQVKLELGHRATIRPKQTSDGFTHDWTMFVRGPEGSLIEYFVDKVVFQLHETFPKPRRVVKEPPFQLSLSGYAGFEMAIDVYFKNKEEPKKVRFVYDLFLHVDGQPPVNHIRCEKLTFRNPTEDFRRKLLKAGGVGVMPMDLDIPTTTTKPLNASGGKPSAPMPTPLTDPSAFTKGKPHSAAAASSMQSGKKPKAVSTTSKESSKSSAPKPKESKESVTSSKQPKTSLKDPKTASKEPKFSSKDSKPSVKESKPSPKEPKPSPKEPKPSPKEVKQSPKVSSKDIKSSTESKSASKDSKDVKPSSKSGTKDGPKQATKRALSSSQSPGSSSAPAKKRKQSTSAKDEKQKEETSTTEKSSSSTKQSVKTKSEKTPSSTEKLSSSTSSEKSSKSKDKPTKVKKSSTKTASSSSKAQDQGLFSPEITKTKPKPKPKQKEVKKELPPFDAELSTEEVGDPHSPASSISLSSFPRQGGGALGMLMQDLMYDDNDEDDDPDMVRPFQSSGPPMPRNRSMSSDSNLSSNSRQSTPSPDIEKQKPISKPSSTSTVGSKKSGVTGKKGTKAEKKPKPIEVKQKAQNSNIDYLYELVDLHKRLMALRDRDKLQQVVDLVGETGSFKVTDTTFDFDLCSLDKNTVKRLQEYVPTL